MKRSLNQMAAKDREGFTVTVKVLLTDIGNQDIRHERHPDCWDTDEPLPLDSCHWEGCGQGASAMDTPCYHRAESFAERVLEVIRLEHRRG